MRVCSSLFVAITGFVTLMILLICCPFILLNISNHAGANLPLRLGLRLGHEHIDTTPTLAYGILKLALVMKHGDGIDVIRHSWLERTSIALNEPHNGSICCI